ncbi:MAG TPA: TIM-barrel domain-containing protein [Terriglobales bacterium]|nr:TIM-barrel domain-containing protein [Terriglobales bacterium]
MRRSSIAVIFVTMLFPAFAAGEFLQLSIPLPQSSRAVRNTQGALTVSGLFYETSSGRVELPSSLTRKWRPNGGFAAEAKMPDGRIVQLLLTQEGSNYVLRLSAHPDSGIVRWGFAADCAPDEYFTGIMERLVDGPQQETWAPGRTEALNLRGQKIDMLVKPTLSLYAPFYISSRGYGLFVKGTWPGQFDFCAGKTDQVQVAFEGPSFEMKIYTASDPASLVRAHALDAGPPILPPKWIYSPWRWRDEHTQRATYYDGTPVTGPFNSEFMEDMLMMKAYGIPNGVYWIDRPWGPGPLGDDDFEIDPHRLPNFSESVKWLDQQGSHMALWIGPFFQGKMAQQALTRHYNMPAQLVTHNNYPLADFTNPSAKQFWEDGLTKVLKLGVVAFKMDRSEEDIPDDGPEKLFDGRSLRENRNAYPVEYVQTAYEAAKKVHPDGDFALMPRAAYTGSSRYGVFWGGDIAGTQEGLRAEIIAVQRVAIMGYPNWGSDTCGYNHQTLDQEMCSRWLAFSAFTPIMEVGPTKNVGFWDLPRPPSYDEILIATWRLYARLHQRLADYSYKCAQEAHETGTPIVSPLFLVEPTAKDSWINWWTYMYGPDLVVSHIWKDGDRSVQVYLPSGSKWRDAWAPEKVYDGGQTIIASAEPHQIPLYVRVGSNLELGDLNQEWRDSVEAAHNKPDLKTLDAGVKSWFEKQNK